MTADQWREIEDLFYRVTEAGAEKRAGLLAAATPGVRREVELLLAGDGKAEPLLQGAVTEGEILLAEATPEQRFGPYKVTGILGSGGMGVVYRVVRDDRAFEKSAAVKVRTTRAEALVSTVYCGEPGSIRPVTSPEIN